MSSSERKQSTCWHVLMRARPRRHRFARHAAHRPVPRYLPALAMEQDVSKHKCLAFAMFCYWIDEYELGKIEGVISTEAGWLEGHEVTLVTSHQDHWQATP
jgi:hypothetical protein